MPCYHPITAYQHKFRKSKNGKALIDFKGGSVREWDEIQLPCGRCVGCRLERSRQWALRCVHEAQYHDANCFITLTFDDAHLDPNGSLVKRDFVLFMKSLRKKIFDTYGKKIRFFHCGEYGELHQRPHHHAIIFGFDFPDKKLWRVVDGFPLYRSKLLESCWTSGFSSVAGFSFESAAYVARYILKKVTGDDADEYYHGREPEYISMSRMPGIGYQWLMDHPEIYNYDECVYTNHKGKLIHCKPPKFYDRIFDEIAPDYMSVIKNKRKELAKIVSEKNRVPDRLAHKEEYKKVISIRLRRSFESQL